MHCCMYWTVVLNVYWTGMFYVLDWCVVCTGLVSCMYWAGVLYVLDWCVVCITHMVSYIPCGLLQEGGGRDLT